MIAFARLQFGTMLSGLQFSSLIRAGFGICLELSAFLGSFVRSRSSLIAENLLLRKQLAFYQEHQIRPRRLTDAARISLMLWSKFCDWRSALVIVKPETLIGWHRRLFKMFWKMKSRPGRPKLPRNIRQLIARMVEENPTWGQGRIADELAFEAGHSSLTANDWGLLAEPATQQRPVIAALEQLRSQPHPIRY